MSMIDRLIQSRENNEYLSGIFLDFSKAFDSVDHTIWLTKLHRYGIRGNDLYWFKSYLSNRKLYVTYNGISSGTKLYIVECHKVLFLVVYFFLYIDDLCEVCKFTVPFLLADDTNLFSSGRLVSNGKQYQ